MIWVAIVIGIAIGIVLGAMAVEVGSWLAYRSEIEQGERDEWLFP